MTPNLGAHHIVLGCNRKEYYVGRTYSIKSFLDMALGPNRAFDLYPGDCISILSVQGNAINTLGRRTDEGYEKALPGTISVSELDSLIPEPLPCVIG